MRVRFAPSPTGFLHIGNARTAVANFAFARREGAKYILRIEDTDSERSTKESELSIMDDLRWLGITWDEGPDTGGNFGPYRQSERNDIYREYTEKLLASGHAYHCYCSKEEIDTAREAAEKAGGSFIYPGTCRNLSAEEKKKREAEGRKPTVRFHVPEGKSITVHDLIKGDVTFGSENIGGDFILVRSDGSPIYNYIVIIDDTLMEITHVIRGEDHLSNTPKQMLIAEALGLPLPQYAHLPLVLGPDKTKLSKRHGITSVEMYRREGYLPEALLNYLAMLGWASDSGQEIMSIDELALEFDLRGIGKSAAVFDFKKLRWMNSQYIRQYSGETIIKLLLPYINEAGYDTSATEQAILSQVILLLRGYCEVLSDIKNFIGIFLDKQFTPDAEADAMLREDYGREIIGIAEGLMDSSINAGNFATELVNMVKNNTAQKGKKLFMPLRAMITGRLKGPELDQALPLIGYEMCRDRIRYCYERYVR